MNDLSFNFAQNLKIINMINFSQNLKIINMINNVTFNA